MPAFKDILGQEHIKKEMQRAIAENKVSHAYMIAGEELAGKKFVANVIAQTLLCEHPLQTEMGTEPCGECASCKKVQLNAHPDLRKVTHEKEGNLSVDEIKDQLIDDCSLMPFLGNRKVYIIPDAQLMNQAAQNKLLKTLEEPPSYVTIILLTTSMESMLTTIRSRCVPFSLRPVEHETLKQYLMQEMGENAVSAEFAARFARGSTGRAVLLVQDAEFAAKARNMIEMLVNLQSMDIARITREMKELFGDKCADVRARDEFFHICLCYFRDILLFRATENPENLILRDKEEYISLVARNTSFYRVVRVNEAMDEAKRSIRSNVNAQYVMQFFIMQIRSFIRTA